MCASPVLWTRTAPGLMSCILILMRGGKSEKRNEAVKNTMTTAGLSNRHNGQHWSLTSMCFCLGSRAGWAWGVCVLQRSVDYNRIPVSRLW